MLIDLNQIFSLNFVHLVPLGDGINQSHLIWFFNENDFNRMIKNWLDE